MMRSRSRPGYIFLMSVLFTGIIGMAAVLSMLLLSWASEQSGLTFAQTNQALTLANTCLEYAFQEIRKNPHYAGGDTLVLQNRGTCDILAIQRQGDNRIFCTKGTYGQAIRRLEARISQLFPTPIVRSYKEVKDSGACN
jgi:hypothetical protein